jgi:hypothetical protein
MKNLLGFKNTNFLNLMNLKSRYLKNKKSSLSFRTRFRAFVISYKEFLYYSVAIMESSKFDRTKKTITAFSVIYGIYLVIFVFSEIRTSESMMFKVIHEKAKTHQTNDYIKNKSDLNRLTYASDLTKYY